MSKVGILSMQRIKNYGSFLQAYALKNIIKNLGHEVEFVDYHIEKPVILEEESIGLKRKIKKGLDVLKYDAKLAHKLGYINHKKNFGKKYFPLLELTEEPNYNPNLDVLVIGSDEVFNCIQKNANVGYSLELFGKNNNAEKVITYAASFGNTTFDKLKKYKKDKEISELLSKIETISVRDNNSGEIVEKLTNKKVVYNLDPVLIYDYMNDCENIPKLDIQEKYMIVYAYNGRISKEESKWIKEYANKKGYKIYSIGGAQKCADKFIDCSPFEVLAYFKNAECIITDTFHGSIFSIIANKNFVTLVRKSVGNEYGNEEKLTDLLSRLELENRITYDIEKAEEILNKEIDYDKVNDIIEKQRKLSIEYLKNNLNKFEDKKYIQNTKENCCGCGACVNICPKKAITLEEDEYGFKYPKIDFNKCINCGLCKKVCNFKKEKQKIDKNVKAYAAVSEKKEILLKSASGGIFATIAKNILDNKGIVYGCSMDYKNIKAEHIRIENEKDIVKLQGSKYVQSDLKDIYLKIKKDLDDNKIVLFSGTPCQVDGLYGFLLGKEYDNLFTIDIICHGVPSEKMFKDYIKFIEKKENIKITNYIFRDKTNGWGLYAKYFFETQKRKRRYKIIPSFKSSYYQMFLDSLTYRENCYKCPYAGTKRIGNITIGDFWGIEQEHSIELNKRNIKSKNGVSCILVNDSKGEKLIQTYGLNLELIESEYKKVANHNNQLNESSLKKEERKKIFNIYMKNGYEELDKWYYKKNRFKNLLKTIWWSFPKKFKNMLKK